MPQSIIRNVPYFAQWESPELIGEIVSRSFPALLDPLWRMSGATTREEYEYWSGNSCGMACLKMILAHRHQAIVPIVELSKKCMQHGGYKPNGEKIDGLFYQPFLEFIKTEYGLGGKILSPMGLSDIENEISSGHYIMASVSSWIRWYPHIKEVTKGGHLILVLGYETDKRLLFYNDPSGHLPERRNYATISYEGFEHYFAGRGMSIG